MCELVDSAAPSPLDSSYDCNPSISGSSQPLPERASVNQTSPPETKAIYSPQSARDTLGEGVLPCPPQGIPAQKRLLRAQMRRTRATLPPQEREANTEALAACVALHIFNDAKTIFGYYPLHGEADILPLLYALASRGKGLALPAVDDDGLMRFYPWKPGDTLSRGTLNVLEPVRARPVIPQKNDVIITPGVAFDVRGNRMGQGAGYYDSYFARHQKGVRLGAAHACQIVENVPHTENDIPMHGVLPYMPVL